jgi:putative Ca2+/H+ antiporter (TMEM165/GDT1 family)
MDALPIATAFFLLLATELGDKTQLSIISLSSSYKWQHVFAGAMLAFLAVDGISLAIGGPLLALVPMRYIQIISGTVFVIFGVIPLLPKKKKENVLIDRKKSKIPLLACFSLVSLMELGDKTQIITITLAAQSSPLLVLTGMMLAFAILTAAAVLIGAKLLSRLPTNWLRFGTSTLFIILGAISILSGTFEITLI